MICRHHGEELPPGRELAAGTTQAEGAEDAEAEGRVNGLSTCQGRGNNHAALHRELLGRRR